MSLKVLILREKVPFHSSRSIEGRIIRCNSLFPLVDLHNFIEYIQIELELCRYHYYAENGVEWVSWAIFLINSDSNHFEEEMIIIIIDCLLLR